MQTPTVNQAPKYRPWESRFSPANRAHREALRIEAQARAGARREKRNAERQALRAEALAKLSTPTMLYRRDAAMAAAGCVVAAITAVPRRVPALHTA